MGTPKKSPEGDSERAKALDDARAIVATWQDHLKAIDGDSFSREMRDALQDFLGAESDLWRLTRIHQGFPETRSRLVSDDSLREIQRKVFAFWKSHRIVIESIRKLPTAVVQKLEALSADIAWKERLSHQVALLVKPWQLTWGWMDSARRQECTPDIQSNVDSRPEVLPADDVDFVESDYSEPIGKEQLAFLFGVSGRTIARRIDKGELRAMPGTSNWAKKIRIHGDDFPPGLKRPNERKQRLSLMPKRGKRQ